jgi:hypothetical protein
MSPLRRRMLDDMTVRNLSPVTQRSYIHAAAKFSQHCGRSPDRLGLEDVHAFQVKGLETDAATEFNLVHNQRSALSQYRAPVHCR